MAVLSIGRGNARTAPRSGIALGAAKGVWDRQPRRETIIAARTPDQGRIAFDFAADLIRGLPEDDLAMLKIANPGAEHGIGPSLEGLQSQVRRAIACGGSTLASFRLYTRDERVSGETRGVFLTVDEWQVRDVSDLPERAGRW